MGFAALPPCSERGAGGCTANIEWEVGRLLLDVDGDGMKEDIQARTKRERGREWSEGKAGWNVRN